MKNKKIICMILFVCYIGSYFALSRYSLNMMNNIDAEGFYYVPCTPISPSLQRINTLLVYFYGPIWIIDHYVFNGPALAHYPDSFID